MNVEEVIKFIENSDGEDLAMIKAACKRMPAHVERRDLNKEDVARLCKFFPTAASTYKKHKYDTTAGTYIRYLNSITDAITGSFGARMSSRGYPVWASTDRIFSSHAEQYKHVFHELTNTILKLAEECGTTYNHGDSE